MFNSRKAIVATPLCRRSARGLRAARVTATERRRYKSAPIEA